MEKAEYTIIHIITGDQHISYKINMSLDELIKELNSRISEYGEVSAFLPKFDEGLILIKPSKIHHIEEVFYDKT